LKPRLLGSRAWALERLEACCLNIGAWDLELETFLLEL